ncbi:MAG: hypothetical protein IIZ06_08075 [Kiritimatiellae bacterium]|nr:hypothetical protein [Kiritimatiellia bacterium]
MSRNAYEYGKYISETQINENVPREAVWQGSTYVGDLSTIPGLLESLGWRPVLRPQTPDDPQEGYHYEERYAEVERGIQVSWVEVADPPPPPRVFSKRKLYRALSAAEVWTPAKAYMEQAGCWEDWEYATTLDEDDPLLVAAVNALKTQLGLTDEQVEAILAASVAE